MGLHLRDRVVFISYQRVAQLATPDSLAVLLI